MTAQLNVDAPKSVLFEKVNLGLQNVLLEITKPYLETETFSYGKSYLIFQYSKRFSSEVFGVESKVIFGRFFLINQNALNAYKKLTKSALGYMHNCSTRQTHTQQISDRWMSTTPFFAFPNTIEAKSILFKHLLNCNATQFDKGIIGPNNTAFSEAHFVPVSFLNEVAISRMNDYNIVELIDNPIRLFLEHNSTLYPRGHIAFFNQEVFQWITEQKLEEKRQDGRRFLRNAIFGNM